MYPFRYLCIRHSEKKYYDWIFPCMLALFVFTVLYFIDAPFLGENGVIEAINELLQILVGFYIASLAAIASFQSEVLDQGFDGESVTLRIEKNGTSRNQTLTRRKFLCHLFGYLAFGSLMIYWMGIVMRWSYPAVTTALASFKHAEMLRNVAAIIYIFCSVQLFCITALGLYYLMHRMHERPPKDH